MRFRQALQLAAVVASAVVAGLFGVQGTLALWTVSASSDAGMIQAADFRLDLNDREIPGGVAAAAVVLGSPTTVLTPSSPVFVKVDVTLTTNATAPFEMEAGLGAASISETSSAELRRNLAVSYAAVAGGDCGTPGLQYTATAAARVSTSDKTTFCVRLALSEGAPLSIQQLGARISVPMEFTQIGI